MTDLVEKLKNLSNANHACTFFVNGPPGSGKSHVLGKLVKDLPKFISRTQVLGPYSISSISDMHFCGPAKTDLSESGFMDSKEECLNENHVTEFWEGVREKISLGAPTTFFVLYDLQNVYFELEALAELFSRFRKIEGAWCEGNFRVCLIVSGCWSHAAFKEYFENTHTSMPYTREGNYYPHFGISIQDIQHITQNQFKQDKQIPYGDILFELTNGYPGVVLEILSSICSTNLSVAQLLIKTREIARNGKIALNLTNFCEKVNPGSKIILAKLLTQTRIVAPVKLSPDLECLYDVGIIDYRIEGAKSFLSFRSWYVELVVFYHAREIGLSQDDVTSEFDQFVPKASLTCIEGYKSINEIENLVRNFVVARLWKDYVPGDRNPLKERVIRFDDHSGVKNDAYYRAESWKQSNIKRNVISVELNPLIAYLSIRDLSKLVWEIGDELNSVSWKEISTSLEDLSGIRDAVMHNQIIDDNDLQRIYELRFKILVALAKE